MYINDPDWKFVFIPPVAMNGTGCDIEALTGPPTLELVFPIMFNIATINYFKAMIDAAVEASLTLLNTPGIKPEADTNCIVEPSTVVAIKVPN